MYILYTTTIFEYNIYVYIDGLPITVKIDGIPIKNGDFPWLC